MIDRLPALRELALSGTRAGDRTAKRIARLTQLRDLGLARAAVTTRALPGLAGLGQLAALDLSSTATAEAIVDLAARLPGLRRLALGGIAATDDIVIRLTAAVPLFQSLSVPATAVGNRGAAALAACPHLHAVDLSGAGVTEAALAPLPLLAGSACGGPPFPPPTPGRWPAPA
jgi:hypothetical protein